MKKIILFIFLLLSLPYCGGEKTPPFLTPHPKSPLWTLVESSPEKALQTEAKSIDDLLARGFALYRLGRLDEAESVFKNTSEMGEKDFSNLGLGMVEEAKGNFIEAYIYYSHSSHPLAQKRAEQIREQALNQALSSDEPSVVSKALLINPTDKRVYLALGNLYLRQGKAFLARAFLQKGIQIIGEDEDLLRLMELSYEQEEKLEQALKIAKKLAELYPDPQNIGLVKELQEKLEEKKIKEKLSPLEGKPIITRGDLALIIDAYFDKFLQERKPPIIVDLYRSYEMNSILKITALGIMKVYSNHTFQPDAEIRRINLAKVLYNLARYLNLSLPYSHVKLKDTSNKYALWAVATDLMKAENGYFRPYDPVSFNMATHALKRLRKIYKETK